MDASKTARAGIDTVDGKTLIVLEGAVDIFFASDLRQAALTLLEKGEDVTVDCEKLERLDTSTLQVFIALKKELGERGRSLHLNGLSSAPGALAALAGLSGHLL